MARPYRSALYIPGSKERALQKARTLPCDAILFDLEDAVTPEEKPAARALLAETLKTQTYGARARVHSIRGLQGWSWGRMIWQKNSARGFGRIGCRCRPGLASAFWRQNRRA
jgi:hypothetical protein